MHHTNFSAESSKRHTRVTVTNRQVDKMGKASKRRPKKDPNAPKAAKKAYQWFCDAKRANLKTAQPHLGFGEIAKELSKMWQAVG
jgi:hypothetical protein